MNIISVIVLSSILLVSSYARAAHTPSGFDIDRCTKCHSESPANQNIEFPRLAAQTPEYIKSAIGAYKGHMRHNFSAERFMARRLAYLKLSNETIGQLAEYFSQLPVIPGTPSDPTTIATGKDIYANSCIVCHGNNAEGSGLHPRLAGQYKSFLTTQLHAYQTGKIDGADEMKAMAQTLSESDIDAVATYLQSL